MQNKKHLLIFPLIMLLSLFIFPYFFSLNITEDIKKELDFAILDYILPNNPKYQIYKNDQWGISFEYPSHLEMVGGPSSTNMRYAIFIYERGEKVNVQNPEESGEMIGIRMYRDISFDDEVDRLSEGGMYSAEALELNGYRAIQIKEYVNPINNLKETSIVVDQGDIIVSFLLSWNANKDLESFFYHIVNNFQFDAE